MIKQKQEILQSGAWQIATHGEIEEEHVYDQSLSDGLVRFFKHEDARYVLDLGAGQGNYTANFREHGLFTNCYDGNPYTQIVSEGRCGIVDLSKDINLMPHDWVMSLEVGEHVPADFESIFISNLDKVNTKGVVLSWAVESQPGYGHVNCRNNDYIKEQFALLGYNNDEQAENNLRDLASVSWFKNTIMVFRNAYVDDLKSDISDIDYTSDL